jgi:hypothetical protein
MKRSAFIFIIWLLCISTAYAAIDVSSAQYLTSVFLSNDTGVDQTNVTFNWGLSSQTLVDANLLKSDALDAAVQVASQDVPFMPASLTLPVLGAFNVGGFDETAAANDLVPNDLILPGGAGDTYEIGLSHAARILRIVIGSPADADWVVTYEFFNGTDWDTLPNIVDNSNGLRQAGLSVISWDIPFSWNRATRNGISAFWMRIRVVSAVNVFSPPIGTSIQYETGVWWAFEDSIKNAETMQYDIFTNSISGGQVTNLRTFHEYFPGPEGFTTADSVSLEPGSNDWNITLDAFLNTQPAADKYIIRKDNALTVFVSGQNLVTAILTQDPSNNSVNSISSRVSDGTLFTKETTYQIARDKTDGILDDTGGSITVGQTQNIFEIAQSYGTKVTDP